MQEEIETTKIKLVSNEDPSLIAFLNRLFVDGEYTFENGVEPPYINRNWLLHGKCCREIERFECIQRKRKIIRRIVLP